MKEDQVRWQPGQRVLMLLDSPRGVCWLPVDLLFEPESGDEVGGVGELVAVGEPASRGERGMLFPFPSFGRWRANCSALRSRSSLGSSIETISPAARPS